MKLALRPATDDDARFVRHVYFGTQRHIIEALFGWRGDEVEESKFIEFYDAANTLILSAEGEDIGWITVQRRPDQMHLDSIYIAKAKQNQGIGTSIIRDLAREARVANVPLRLSTAKINAARRLYERLGFRVVDEDEFKVYLEHREAFVIRKACPNDREAMTVVRREAILSKAASHYARSVVDAWVGDKETDREAHYQRQIVDPEVLSFVAEVDHILIGFVFARPMTEELLSIYVRPNLVGRVGYALLSRVELEAFKTTSTLRCVAALNAVAFYEANGYAIRGAVGYDDGSGVPVPCVEMEKLRVLGSEATPKPLRLHESR